MIGSLKVSQKKRIKDLPLSQRPLEKLFEVGQQNLSDTELVALLLGSGTKKKNAIALAQSLIQQTPLHLSKELDLGKLLLTPGIGKTKAARIIAAIELGQRVFGSQQLQKVLIRKTEDAVFELKDIAEKHQEHMVVLYLNARHELIQKQTVGVGNLNTNIIEAKQIFSHGLTTPCAAIIIAHNHPSGDPTPSSADIQFTLKIQQASEYLGIAVIDHIIVSKDAYYSFKDSTLLQAEV